MRTPHGRCRRMGPAAALAVSLVLVAAARAAAPPPDEQENPYLWKPHVTSVAVFKNGLGFFVREGDAGLRDGWCVTREVPPAAFGTLAIYSHSEDETVDIVGCGPGEVVEFDGVDAPKDTDTKRRRLTASLHLRVQLTYTHKGGERTAAGRLVSVEHDFAALETPTNTFAVPVAGVKRLQVLDLPVRVHLTDRDNQPPKRATIGMAYLRKGITWIPEYTLKIIDEETAELTLRGTLVNMAEDLVHTDVNFVVGVPHFVHTDYLTPVAVGQVIRTIGAAIAPAAVCTQIASRAAITSNLQRANQFAAGANVVDRAVAAAGDVKAAVGNLPQMAGPAGADFTVYTKKNLTVRRGEKAIVTLFTKRITYSHLYRWSPPERLRHHLVLNNSTDTAWTTGPCLAVSGARPLSEDLLKYTPRGGKVEIRVTAAVNVAHDQSEKETDRKLRAYSPSHNYWLDLVTIAGRLKVRNYEKKTIDIIIEPSITGKPTDASDQGAIWLDTAKLKLIERQGKIRWRISLEPGETREVTYTYERYVPSR